jgi:hypothetical protein
LALAAVGVAAPALALALVVVASAAPALAADSATAPASASEAAPGSAPAAARTPAPAPTTAPARIEARSADLLAVGVVRGDRMTLHVSRLLDNAPVRDAAVTVLLRGTAYPTVAEADGSFTLQTQQLTLPGAAAVEIRVGGDNAVEALKGTLQVAAGAPPAADRNEARQLGWWVLNFGVCFGFLWLYSRRRKAKQVDGQPDS